MPTTYDTFRDALLDTSSVEHKALLDHAKGLVELSRKTMGKHYTTWDIFDAEFRSQKRVDKEDRSAQAKGQPTKMIVPIAFAQVMTFVAFAVMTITQNKRFFELEPTGQQLEPLLRVYESVLERDTKRNQWNAFLVQFFLDAARFSIGVAEVCYKEEYRYIRMAKTETETGAFGVETQKSSNDFQRLPTFVGNKVYPVSPYRFFPDTRLPLTRFQEGEFCGSEDMFSMSSLKSDEGALFNLDKIPKMSDKDYKTRQTVSRIDDMQTSRSQSQEGGTGGDSEQYVKSGSVVITKLALDIIPANFKTGEGDEVLDKTCKFPVRYILWYANDKTIIRFEEAPWLHCQFPYIAAQYLPDQHKTINNGLSEVCDQIANLITWKLNAHVTSQRSSLDSKFIVDPAGIDIKSLESRSPYIFLKRNASQSGVDRYIKQFATVDTTAGVMSDISALQSLLETITGLSGNMQGQYAKGRRSATESQVVTQGASARGKTTLSCMWDAAFQPLGRQLLCNNRQEMDFETFARIVGPIADPSAIQLPELYAMFQGASLEDIACDETYFIFDGTLPSEKAFLAQALQEILVTILSNPEVGAVLGYGPEQVKELFKEVYELRGVTPGRLPAPQPTAAPGTPALPGQPQPQLPAPAATSSPSPSL